MAKISNSKMKVTGLHDGWVDDYPGYNVGDLVTENGELFICTIMHNPALGNNSNGSPSQPFQNSWMSLSAAETGGVAWGKENNYNPGDIVMSDDGGTGIWGMYYCAVGNTSAVSDMPLSANTDWVHIKRSVTEVGGVAFDVAKDYILGDMVTHLGDAYQCTAAHAAGAWDLTHFEMLLNWTNTYNDTVTYQKNQIARDGSWTGIANKETTDRIAPQLSGDPLDSITGNVFTDELDTSVVSVTHTYTMTETGYIDGVEVQLPEFTTETLARVKMTNLATLSQQTFNDIIVLPNNWTPLPTSAMIAKAGDVIEVVFTSYNSDAATEFSMSSTTNEDVGAPSDRETNFDDLRTPSVIEIDYNATDGSGYQVDLDGVSAGSVITIVQVDDTSRSFILEVTAVNTTSPTSVQYTVSIISTNKELRDNKEIAIRISDPITADTHYCLTAGYYVTNPSFCTVGTALAFAGVDQGAPFTDAYGINISFQEASISDDWDFLAISGGTGGAGASSFTGLMDTPTDYTGQAGLVPHVNIAETGLEFLASTAGTEEFVDSMTYVDGAQVWIQDPERPTFITRYQNTSAADIVPNVPPKFDPLEWTAIESSYRDPYGLEFTQTGLISGGALSIGGAPDELNIAAGEAIVVDKTTTGSTEAPVVTRVTWLDATLTLAALGTDKQYEVYVDSLGVVQVMTPPVSQEFYRNNIRLGYVASAPSAPAEISLVQTKPLTIQSMADTVGGIHSFFIKSQIVRGGAITAASLLQFNVDNGSIYGYNANYMNDPLEPHILAMPGQTNLTFTYADSAGNFLTTTQDIVPGSYEDMATPGTIVALDGVTQIASTQLVYWSEPYGGYFVMYGQRAYASLQAAVDQRANYSGEVIQPTEMMYGSVFVGYIFTVFDATDLGVDGEALILNAAGQSISGAGTNVEELDGLIDVVAPAPANKDILVYDTASSTWIAGANPSANTNIDDFTQIGHTLVIGDAVTVDGGGNWILASAVLDTRLPNGIISSVTGDNFTVATSGFMDYPTHGFATGIEYFIDPLNDGKSVTTIPTTPGQYKINSFMPINGDKVIIGSWVAVEV